MRRIAALPLAVAVLLAAVPARAAESFDAVYSGQSAFVTLERGKSEDFQVFWLNTGTASWTRDVVLAACTADKVSCDQQDESEAPFNAGWVSPTRYAYAQQSSVAPGAVGAFVYRVTVPVNATGGTYRFNGTLWHIPTASAIHNVGYYHDLTVLAAGASTLSSIEPSNGSDAGGETVTLLGAGFICAPEPKVSFGDTDATVLACGPGRLTVKSPKHAAGDVTVTVTNRGGPASNGLLFTFEDRTPPTFDSLEVVGQAITLKFSEDVCVAGGTLSTKLSLGKAVIRVNVQDIGGDGAGAVAGDAISFGNCTSGTAFSTATAAVDPTKRRMIPGDLVTVAILAPSEVKDKVGNAMAAAKSVATVAVRDSTAPTLTSAEVVASNKVLVRFSETIKCGNGITAGFTVKPATTSTASSTATDCSGTYAGTTILVTFPAATFAVGTTGTLTYDPALLDADKQVVDTSNNPAAKASIPLTPYAPAKLTAAKVTTNSGVFSRADAGDAFRLTFDRDMENTQINSINMRVLLTDSDGTSIVVRCGGLAGEGGSANPSDGNIAADCVRDPDGTGTLKVFQITLREDSINAADTLAVGAPSGLQWPATIGQLDGFVPRFSDLTPVDLAGSTDKLVEQ